MDQTKVDVNVIYTFLRAGVRIVHINERYYSFSAWEAATPTMLKHKLKGKDITETIQSAAQMANRETNAADVVSAITKWQDYKEHPFEFHHSTKYSLYLP